MFNTESTRRNFLGKTALTTGAVIAGPVALELLTTGRAWAADFGSDADVLNYALTLEYLESEFYKQANASGKLTGAAADALKLIGSDEDAHVVAITQTIQKIGATPVAKPTITFPAGTFDSQDSILKLAKVFEETGVGAYLGAAGSIQNKDILQAAAGIFGVEARHAAAIGFISNATPEGGIYMGATETGKAKGDVLAAVMPFLGGLPAAGFAPASNGNGVSNLLPAAGAGLAGAGLLLAGLRRRGSRTEVSETNS